MKPLLKSLTKSVKHWYLYLILGLVFIFTGIWTLTEPAKSYDTLSFLFSISFLISGVIYMLFAIGNRKNTHNWGWKLAYGIMLLILGINLLSSPDLSRASLALFVGFATLLFAFSEIVYSFELKSYGIKNWFWLLIFGVLSLFFAFLMIANPAFSGLTIIFYTSLTFFFLGITYIVNAFQLRKVKKITKKIPKEVKDKYNAIMHEIERHLNS